MSKASDIDSAPADRSRRSRVRAWLELIRVPNLLTVPGDPMVGFIAAGAVITSVDPRRPAAGPGWQLQLVLVVLAALGLYIFGLVQNDVLDRKTDARERRDRPIPSGAVSVEAAAILAGLCLLVGLGAAWSAGPTVGWVAVVLTGLITLYNGPAKRVPVIGPLVMGACRGASVLMGAALAGVEGLYQPGTVLVASLVTAYIAAVTHIAREEAADKPVGMKRNLPAGVLAFGFTFFFMPPGTLDQMRAAEWAFLALALLALGWALYCAFRLAGPPRRGRVPKTVGQLIAGLMLLEAAIVVLGGGWAYYVAGGLLVAFVMHRLLSRVFYAS